MFPKKKRLSRKAFNRFFASGVRVHTPAFTCVYHTETENDLPFQVAASVSKKVHKSAVKRNRLRRQMYHALKTLADADKLVGVYILIAKPAAQTFSFADTSREITNLIGRVAKKR